MEEVRFFFMLLFKCLRHLIRCPFFHLVHPSLHSVASFLLFLLTELSSLFPGSFFPHTHLPRSASRMTLLVGMLTHEGPSSKNVFVILPFHPLAFYCLSLTCQKSNLRWDRAILTLLLSLLFLCGVCKTSCDCSHVCQAPKQS